MSQKNQRLKRFFADHPICCFCGGERVATTEDHQPGRIFFRNREWPEGFSFPACEECNAVSRASEKIVGILVHGHSDDEDRTAYQRNLESVRREFPEEIQAMLTSRNEQRKILKIAGLSLPAGVALRDFPIVTMRRNFWDPHFTTLSRKLLLALHYQCFGRPLSRSGALWHYVHTNFDLAADRYPKEVLDIARRFASPMRNKQYLNDQFSIRWTVVDNSRTAMFVIQLQKKLVITGFTTEEPQKFEDKEDTLAPFGPWIDQNLQSA